MCIFDVDTPDIPDKPPAPPDAPQPVARGVVAGTEKRNRQRGSAYAGGTSLTIASPLNIP